MAETISAALRKESIRHLLSFRTKHPDEFAGKLLRKKGKPKYEQLGEDLNETVTDLAGVRIVVYDPRDEQKVAGVIRKVLQVAPGDAADTDFASPQYSERDDAAPYQATHLLVVAPEGPEHSSVQGARCEVQICNVAAHLFNEVEHDISYKRKDASPTGKTLEALESLRRGCRQLERAAEETFKRHERDIADQRTELLDAEDLRSGLEKAAGGTLEGDFRALFGLLSPVMSPLNVHSIEQAQGTGIATLVKQGRSDWSERGNTPIEEATAVAVALFRTYGPEFSALASDWDGSPSPVVDAIVRLASKEKKP